MFCAILLVKMRKMESAAPGIADTIGVVLGSNPRKRVSVIAVAVEVGVGDLRENAWDGHSPPRLFLHIGPRTERAGDRYAGKGGHFFGTCEERNVALFRRDGVERRADGGSAGGAGIACLLTPAISDSRSSSS
jgi:hypothetical protein